MKPLYLFLAAICALTLAVGLVVLVVVAPVVKAHVRPADPAAHAR
jgi:hypothetical protein